MARTYSSLTDPYGGRIRDETAEERRDRLTGAARPAARPPGGGFAMHRVPDLSSIYERLEARRRASRWSAGDSGLAAAAESALGPQLTRARPTIPSRSQRFRLMSPEEKAFRAMRIKDRGKRRALMGAIQFGEEAEHRKGLLEQEERRTAVQEKAEERLAAGQEKDIALKQAAEKRIAGEAKARLAMDQGLHDVALRRAKAAERHDASMFPLAEQERKLTLAKLKQEFRKGERSETAELSYRAFLGNLGTQLIGHAQSPYDYGTKYDAIMKLVHDAAVGA